MKIITYNVNGIRAASDKGLLDWLRQADADIVCLQEVKALPEQINLPAFEALGYQGFFHPAEKKGYSGVATFSRRPPTQVVTGMDIPDYDREGRVLRLDFEGLSVLNAYFPSGSSGDERQAFKYRFLDDFQPFADRLRASLGRLVICGDFNICHQAIDIHNPKSNANTSGFLPAERSWMDRFFGSGYHDAFRRCCPDPHHYTWWSYRSGARSRNVGWRIDYHAISDALLPDLRDCRIHPEAVHADHCPVSLLL